jgi:DNA-binding IscR family transcriptional regulator
MGFGIESHKMAEILSAPQNLTDFNLQYLKQKGLVQFTHETFGGYYVRINAFGCDVVEHKKKFAGQFPFIEVTVQNQNIQGNAYGAVQASGNAQVTVNMQDAFQKAYKEINEANLGKEQKELLQNNVKELEQELQKGKDADANAIKKAWIKVKQNANWLIPTLAQAVTKGLKITCGIP